MHAVQVYNLYVFFHFYLESTRRAYPGYMLRNVIVIVTLVWRRLLLFSIVKNTQTFIYRWLGFGTGPTRKIFFPSPNNYFFVQNSLLSSLLQESSRVVLINFIRVVIVQWNLWNCVIDGLRVIRVMRGFLLCQKQYLE